MSAPCPLLPDTPPTLGAVAMREAGADRGETFYLLALRCAQSLWLRGLPAQSILMLNRAFSADLRGDEAILQSWPAPYAALDWILRNARGENFIGNPRRHFQHLATRMSGPRREVRIWRAWACWRIAMLARPDDPADEKQIREEHLVLPDDDEIARQLRLLGWNEEASIWQAIQSRRPS